MAIWYEKDRSQNLRIGYHSGHVLNYGSLTYDHTHDGVHTQLAECEVKFRNMDLDTMIKIRHEINVQIVFNDLKN